VVKALGHRTDVREVLSAADFFVLPSQREGLSYALLEAMALGLPVVVSDAPGNPEAVGDTGIVARQGDTKAFADAFRRLLDPGLRAALGEQARKRVLALFAVDDMVRRTREVYRDVAAKGTQ
jgi:glycosyltransferase involved in cell wall biosynthesis